jgi:hypothetical protein
LKKDIHLRTEHSDHWFQANVISAEQSVAGPRLLFHLYNIDGRKRTALNWLEQTQTDTLPTAKQRRLSE